MASRSLPPKLRSTRIVVTKKNNGFISLIGGLEPVHDVDFFEAKGQIIRTADQTMLREYIWDWSRLLWAPKVLLYARMGLHRYNLLQGKNFQFVRVEKYNATYICGPNSYYITSVAFDRENGRTQYFHTSLDEERRFPGIKELSCSIAIPRGVPRIYNDIILEYDETLPEWPLENPFEDTKHFYLVHKSELQDNRNDWIRLYLELIVAWNGFVYNDLSNLEIMKVAIATTTSQYPNEGYLNAKNATVYISYRDPNERVGKDVDRIAIVKREFHEESECFSLVGYNQSVDSISKVSRGFHGESECFSLVKCSSLVGHNQSVDRKPIVRRCSHEQSKQRSETISKKVKKRQSSFRRHLGLRQPWLLLNPKWRKVYQIHGVRMARRLHKTRPISICGSDY